jgi:hypothetical protein
MASPKISIFNTSPFNISMSVNNGSNFTIAGVPNGAWSPQTPASGGPSWNNGRPAPNVLAPGANYMSILPAGSPMPLATTVMLSEGLQWTSLQLFIFLNSYDDVSWTVLNGGQFVGGNIPLPQS